MTPVSASVRVGQTQAFVAQAVFSDGSTTNVTAMTAWTSSDTTVATMDYEGRARCINLGHCTPACAQGAKASTDITYWPQALRARVEEDLGTRVDWVAVDHFNTGHPHTHIIVNVPASGAPDPSMAGSWDVEAASINVTIVTHKHAQSSYMLRVPQPGDLILTAREEVMTMWSPAHIPDR